MQARFHIEADGVDITPLLNDRLVMLRLTDKPGLAADTCELKIDDRDGKVALPPKGAMLRVSLGRMDGDLHFLGLYRIDEVVMESSPMTMTVRGKSADLRKEAKSQRCQAFENTTLEIITDQIARRHGWLPVCRVQAQVARADQLRESDMHFITRLAGVYGATATVKDNKLLVLPRGAGKSASGETLPVVEVTPGMLSRYSFTFADRALVAAVSARSHDHATGRQTEIRAVNGGAGMHDGAEVADRHPHADMAAARAAAQAGLSALNRGTASGQLDMPGDPAIGAERRLVLKGFKEGLNGEYLVGAVEHTYAGKSWQMLVTVNAGNGGKTGPVRGSKGGPALAAAPPSR
jgi:uncharacterized protein